MKHEYLNTTSIDGKETCLRSLGRVQDVELVKDFMEFQFSDSVAVQDVHSGTITLGANPKARGTMWKYIKENWKIIHGRLSGNSVVLNVFFKESLTRFASHEQERDIAIFFKDKDTAAYDRGLIQVSDTIQGNASYKERDEELVLEWLVAHDYV